MNEAETRAELIDPVLLELKYHTISDAQQVLGEVKNINALFVDFQQYLYTQTLLLTQNPPTREQLKQQCNLTTNRRDYI